MSVTPFRSWISLGLTSLVGLSLGFFPATATSPLPPTKTEQQAIAQFLSTRNPSKICAESFDLETAKRGSRAYQINSQTYFIMVQCFLAAYQGNYEFYLYSPKAKGNAVKPLPVTLFTENEGKLTKSQSPYIGGFPTYNPKQRLLIVQTKYRGLGDCGSTGRYRLENNTLKLVDFKAKFACNGKMTPYQKIFP